MITKHYFWWKSLLSLLLLSWCAPHATADKDRARDLGIPFDGHPGPNNAITDVAGVEVGYSTIVAGKGELVVGRGPIRTGVTAILPRGKESADPVFAGWFTLNGNGEMTGTTWIEESGFLEGPIMITNTHSVGTVRDAVIQWQVENDRMLQPWSLPVVAETYDGWLNDTNGFHVKKEHAFEALANSKSGAIEEGNVGGGTGMICYEFKGGTGTASRKLPERVGGYTVGVLVQANFGARHQLLIAGVPVGKTITENTPWTGGTDSDNEQGSIIAVVATDAPLLPHQLKRIVKRVSLGIARTGGTGGNGSGDIFVAFSTANFNAARPGDELARVEMLPNEGMNPLFSATIFATEEAIINALVAAETMTGRDKHTVVKVPVERVREIMKEHGRLIQD